MRPHQFRELLGKFLQGDCTPEEEQFVIDWYQNISRREDPGVVDEVGETEALEEKIWSAINPRPLKRNGFVTFLKYAAIISIPLLACLGLFLFHKSPPSPSAAGTSSYRSASLTRFHNDGMTVRDVTLPDSSKVSLHAKSEIIISEDFGRKAREVKLTGEAFFKIKRNPEKPFIVYANELVTRVIGTSFNIRAYADDRDIVVAVVTGKVSVYRNQGGDSALSAVPKKNEVVLTPNQEMVYDRRQQVFSRQLIRKPAVMSEIPDFFPMKFENEEVARIFEVIEENYGVEIRYDPFLVKNCRLTTSMSAETLNERIRVICKAIDASYEVNGDVITIIKRQGC